MGWLDIDCWLCLQTATWHWSAKLYTLRGATCWPLATCKINLWVSKSHHGVNAKLQIIFSSIWKSWTCKWPCTILYTTLCYLHIAEGPVIIIITLTHVLDWTSHWHDDGSPPLAVLYCMSKLDHPFWAKGSIKWSTIKGWQLRASSRQVAEGARSVGELYHKPGGFCAFRYW